MADLVNHFLQLTGLVALLDLIASPVVIHRPKEQAGISGIIFQEIVCQLVKTVRIRGSIMARLDSCPHGIQGVEHLFQIIQIQRETDARDIALCWYEEDIAKCNEEERLADKY